MSGLVLMYVVLSGVSLAALAIGFRLAASGIHPALGTAIATGVAFLVNIAVVLTNRAAGVPMPFSKQSFYVLVVVGVATACANLFNLAAYANGLKVTSSFPISGILAILILLVGFLILKEPFTWMKLLAIGLILTGIFLLQRTSG
jgi:uncharacterized membrane protein